MRCILTMNFQARNAKGKKSVIIIGQVQKQESIRSLWKCQMSKGYFWSAWMLLQNVVESNISLMERNVLTVVICLFIYLLGITTLFRLTHFLGCAMKNTSITSSSLDGLLGWLFIMVNCWMVSSAVYSFNFHY